MAVTAGVGFSSESQGKLEKHSFNFTAGARYYVWNALFAGATYQSEIKKPKEVNYMIHYIGAQVGYTYYLSDKVFFEPTLFFKQGLDVDNMKDSQFGLSIGIGINF